MTFLSEKWLTRIALVAGTQRTLGRIRKALELVSQSEIEGWTLLQRFLAADVNAGGSIDVVGRACRDLLDWSRAQPWSIAEKDQFRLMIVQSFKARSYGLAAVDVRLDRMVEDVVGLDLGRAERLIGTLERGCWALATGNRRQAFEAFRRIYEVSPTSNPNWALLVEELSEKKLPKLIESAERMREALAAMPEGTTFAALYKRLPSEHGQLVKIRGALAEIYAAECRIVRQEVNRSLAHAAFHAVRMGEPWEAVKAVGTITLDGTKSYDQVVLLVDRVAGEAILHTGVQIKVEKKLTAFKSQLPNDLARETWGKVEGSRRALERTRLPVISIEADGKRLSFSLRPTPPEMTTRRLVFFAEGGTISPSDAAALARAGIEAKAIPLDMSIHAFEALTLEILDILKSFNG